MNTIINAVLSLSIMGILFAVGLGFAAKKFAVEVDPKESAILGVLPGANCGGCGFPGCGGLAAAIALGQAPINGCPVGGAACAEKIAAIMGVESAGDNRQVLHVTCNGGKKFAGEKAAYQGIIGCRAATLISNGQKGCSYGCLGFGSCVDACQFNAIHITSEGIAKVNPENCVACGKCVEACPRNIITYIPYGQNVVVDCNNRDKGKEVKDVCSVGCIGCGICQKNCPTEAITVTGNLAKIDYNKCTQCLICVQKCPTKAISMDLYKAPEKKEA